MIAMLKDARDLPRRFWETYALVLGFVLLIATAAASDFGWWLLVPFSVGMWGIFTAFMVVYELGKSVAYREAVGWAEEARRAMLEGRSELEEISSRLDRISGHFQGPS